MLDFLLNHSIHIIGVVAAIVIGVSEYRGYLRKKNLTPSAFRSLVRENFNRLGNELLIKFAASAILTLIISMVSFRELWLNDAFHIVFLTNLLYGRVITGIKRLFPE